MSKELSVILLGVAVVILPYLGVPSGLRTMLLVLAGLTLVVIGFLLRAQGTARMGKNSPYHPFVESDTAKIVHDYSHESHKEGITSLN
jgi:VIT1/CCC1 family predicted Fe2+/Mn2+ transporter